MPRGSSLVLKQRRTAGRLTAIAAAAAAAAYALVATCRGSASANAFALGLKPWSVVGTGRAPSFVPRCAEAIELEAPPSDAELTEEAPGDARPFARMIPKRERPGTCSHARTQLYWEAWRLKPYIQPLVERGFSLMEINFALNRQGSKLRHLLWRPREGLPVFTVHKTKRILKRARFDDGERMWKVVRPQFLPPNAPGATYDWKIRARFGEVYAEVPPLGWQKDKKALPDAESGDNQEDAPADEAEETAAAEE